MVVPKLLTNKQRAYAKCRNYKVITQADYTIGVFENHLYILSDRKKQTIEFYCPSDEIMTRVIASRLCVHLHMLMWEYGCFCLHGGATTYDKCIQKQIYFADKILVIEDGCIIEQGSHNELMRQNGKYAHLFKLQANRYK